jgi:hypothetical protein
MTELTIATELVYCIKKGDANGAKQHLEHLLNEKGTHKGVFATPEFVYALRTAISRNDAVICRILTDVLDNTDVIDAGTVTAASFKSVEVFMAVVGVKGHCLLNPEFNEANHPILSAASVGNFPVVKFIVDWIRDGGGAEFLIKTTKIEVLKNNVIIQAAMANSVSICKLIATHEDHHLLAFKTLVSAGHTDGAKRLVNEVNFVANSFELLKICAPFPDLLEYAMRSKSLKDYKDKMPTVYSQLAMQSAITHHEDHVDSVTKAFKEKLKMEATRQVLESGCSTKDAITSAHAKLHKHYITDPFHFN